MHTLKLTILLICLILQSTNSTKAQYTPTFPPADTIFVFTINNNDTTKRVLKNRLFHIYDKQGHIREVLFETNQNKTWQYEKRMLFGYNALSRLQSIKYELWDSTAKDWLKFKRRTFAYNVRHLPTEYTDEIWNNKQNTYLALSKAKFIYNNKNQPYQAIYKNYKQGIWTDSLRQTAIYDSSGRLAKIEQSENLKGIWRKQMLLEYKYENNRLKEILRKQAQGGAEMEITGKTVFSYNQESILNAKQEQVFVSLKKPFRNVAGVKSWYNPKKNQWTYSFYRIENEKSIITEQWVLCPTAEKVQVPLKDFPFPLTMNNEQ